jgi:hypothetical protein
MVGMKPPQLPTNHHRSSATTNQLRRLLQSCDGRDFTDRRDTAIRLFIDTGVFASPRPPALLRRLLAVGRRQRGPPHAPGWLAGSPARWVDRYANPTADRRAREAHRRTSISTQQSLALACLSPEPAASGYGFAARSHGRSRPRSHRSTVSFKRSLQRRLDAMRLPERSGSDRAGPPVGSLPGPMPARSAACCSSPSRPNTVRPTSTTPRASPSREPQPPLTVCCSPCVPPT